MNLWLRLALLVLSARARGPLAAPFGVSRLAMRVLPFDLDANGHLNNGRAMTLMDLGRVDLVLRTGLARAARGRGWAAVLLGAQVLFRRELRPWQRFRLETRIVAWDAAAIVMEHRLIAAGHGRAGAGGAEATAVLALVRGGLYDRRARRFVPPAELLALLGLPPAPSPAPSPEVAAFLAAGEALRAAL